MARDFRDPFTGRRYLSERAAEEATASRNEAQLAVLGVTARQAMFNARNRLPLGTRAGRSVLTGRPTAWNERAGRYERFGDDAERARYRQTFLERMRRVHGRDHLLDDPDQQRRMLAGRSISGTYRFASDGAERTYTGQEELGLLRFLDEALGWPGADIQAPAPQAIRYLGPDGKEHWYIPDAWIESLNLVIEVKGEQHGGWRKRDAEIERTKDEVLGTSGYGYVKVEDGDFEPLLDALARLSATREAA